MCSLYLDHFSKSLETATLGPLFISCLFLDYFVYALELAIFFVHTENGTKADWKKLNPVQHLLESSYNIMMSNCLVFFNPSLRPRAPQEKGINKIWAAVTKAWHAFFCFVLGLFLLLLLFCSFFGFFGFVFF